MSLIDKPGSRTTAFGLWLAVIGTAFAGTWRTSQSTAWGILCGGLVALLAFVAVLLRRRPEDGSLRRNMRGEADERDRLIAMEAGSWTGTAAFACLALGLVASTWGLETRTVLTASLWVLLVVHFAGHWWLDRNR